MKLSIGNDVGNSNHKMIINGEYINQPSCYSRVDKVNNIEVIRNTDIFEDLYNNITISINNQNLSGNYYIGKRSLTSGYGIYNMDISDCKSVSNIYYINTLALISAYVIKSRGFDIEDEDIIVDMACNLPVNQYNRHTVDIVKEKFKGNHNIKFHIGNKKIDLNIIFEYIKVLPESVAITFNLIKDDNTFMDSKILHISIGEGTTEYPITRGIEFEIDFINGTYNGIGYAIEKAIEKFKTKFGLRNFSRQDYDEIIKNTNHKYSNIAKKYINEPLEYESKEIFKKVKNEIERANGDIDYIIVHGGGSILMREFLEDGLNQICKQKMISLIYSNQIEAVKLESLGLFNFTQTDLFNTLKEKALKKELIK